MNSAGDVNLVRKQVIYLEKVKCPYIAFMFVKFLMYGVLISWDPFPLHVVIPILSCLWIKWVEAVVTRTDDAKTIVKNIKSHILHRYGVPKAPISDRGTHFCDKTLGALLAKYHITHKVSAGYHPQTNGQAEISNREIKSNLEKVVNPDSSLGLPDCIQDTYRHVTLLAGLWEALSSTY